MSVSASSKLLRIKYYSGGWKEKKKKLHSTSSSLDHLSKSPWRSGSRQACWEILRGQDMEKGKEKCQRDEAERRGNETERERTKI